MADGAKELIFDEQARSALAKGIKTLTDLVKVTMGPKGHHVGLDASWGAPKITSDGNAIAADVELKDQYENMGVSMGKEVAQKMKESCGDGTTTSLLLLGALVEGGVKNIASGASPIFIKRGMEKALEAVIHELEKGSTPVKKGEQIQEIASSSASGHEEVGELIAQAFGKVGHSGVISIEESKTTETSIEMVEGMEFDRGYTSAYFCTNTEKMLCEMENPYILVTDKKISSIQEVLPVLQAVATSGKELLIIADDLEGDALSTLVVNRLRGTLKVCAVKAPGFGDRRKAMLEDIAALTGATFITEEVGQSLKDASIEQLGSAEKVSVGKDRTTLISGAGSKERIMERIAQIDGALKAASSDYDREKLQERKAKLSGGVAVIRVGAPTEPAMKAKKQAFQDSLSSTKAAIEEGTVTGGGIALIRSGRKAKKVLSLKGEEALGAMLVFEACAAPFRQLVENCGYEPSLVIEEVLSKGDAFGFNIQSEMVEDLAKAGISDPLKVIKSGLRFAVSGAGNVLLSECLVGDAPEEA